VTRLPRAWQFFSRKNDEDAFTVRRCQHPEGRDFRQLVGKAFGLHERAAKRKQQVHYRDHNIVLVAIQTGKRTQKMTDDLVEKVPELETEAIAVPDHEAVFPDCVDPTPIEVCQAIIIEQKVTSETGFPRRPLEIHLDGYRKEGKMKETKTLPQRKSCDGFIRCRDS
jgi:hypothetical protein